MAPTERPLPQEKPSALVTTPHQLGTSSEQEPGTQKPNVSMALMPKSNHGASRTITAVPLITATGAQIKKSIISFRRSGPQEG